MLAASAMIGAGAGNQFDPRASFLGGNLGASFMQPGMGDNRMMGVNMNAGYNQR
jgi:hypothetical protein